MGHVSILLDKMRLDEMGTDEIGINRNSVHCTSTINNHIQQYAQLSVLTV